METISKTPDFTDEDIEVGGVNTLLLLLISKKQLHTALNIFNIERFQLKDKLKPVYYALMYLLKEEYPDEYIKMGRELEEPMKDILKVIEEYAVDYA